MKYDVKTKLTDEQIYEFCRSRYYVDDEEGSYLSGDFELFDEEYIKNMIEEDIYALKELLNISYKERG